MKKIALLLAMIMLVSVFSASCTTVEETEQSSSSSEASQEEVSETQKPASVVKTGVAVGENAHETIISTGKSYVKSAEAGEAYPDTYATELTDAVRTDPSSNNYSDESLSGYTISGSRLNIDIDLGYECDKIYAFKLGYLCTSDAGISPPASVAVYASIDGKKWTIIGNMKKPDYVEGTMQDAYLTEDEYIKARYVRFMVRGASAWTFLDEAIVIADVEGESANKKYFEAINGAYAELGAIAAPSNGSAINRELDKTLISEGKTYTISGETVGAFPDDGKMLTDGKVSGYYEGETWVGFKGNAEATVKIDLGETVTDISSVEATFFTNTAVGMYMPVALEVAAIEGDTRTELGILYGNAIISNGDYTFSLPFAKTVTARYIEVTMIATESTMYLVEEIGVYAYREPVVNTLYPDIVIETGAKEESGASKEYKNLILGKTQQITASSDPGVDNYKNNTAVNSTIMTNGNTGVGTDIHNGTFFKFNSGGGRKVIYDLDYIRAVDKFTAYFTHQSDWAVYAPSTVTVYLSADGTDWYQAGVMTVSGNSDPQIYKGELKLSKKVKARYVVFSFAVKGWAGCAELEVYGTESASGAVAPASAGIEKKKLFENERMQPSDDLLGGAKDLCLLYHGKDVKYVAEDLIPYLAYVDADGNPKDVMFDSFLFLMTGEFPSGAKPHADGSISDWEWAIDDVLTDGENMCALDAAAGQIKEALSLDAGYKYKVTMGLYYPSLERTSFGDVDGDGVSENFSNNKDRIKAFEWYIKTFEDKFAAMNFENIELVGYYWYHEAMVDGEEDIKLLNAVSDIVHKYDRTFFWIPYFQSNGYNAWSEYGFDVACMQPNYVFTAGAPYSNVVNCANLTKLYGMGFEMEICGEALTSELFFKKYMQYISAGAEYGYMDDCIVMYYQSVYDFKNAAYSKTFMGRTVYEQTYHFIKGDLKYKPDTLDKASFDANKNEIYIGTIPFSEEKMREFRLEVTADHGSVTLNDDSTFTFYPEKDYVGEVTFSFSYSEYLGWSDACEVVINVK